VAREATRVSYFRVRSGEKLFVADVYRVRLIGFLKLDIPTTVLL
jgi:hypothetical protein